MRIKICQICGEPLKCEWIDKNRNGSTGEAACLVCGTPYQLKDGTPDQCIAGEYPYISIMESWIPATKKYWEEKKIPPFSQSYFGGVINTKDFYLWLKENFPEIYEKESK